MGRGTITTEAFIQAHESEELRDYIARHARRHSKRLDVQQEYMQEAWLAISCAPSHYCVEALMTIAGRAIYSAYWQNHKEQLLAHGHA